MKQKVAVKALITNSHGEVLLLRKSNDDSRHSGHSGRFNLPGGKIDIGETIDAALIREVREEAGLQLLPTNPHPFFAGEWRPIVQGEHLQIIGMFFICHKWNGHVTLNDEHDGYEWVNKQTYPDYNILPPEDKAIAKYFATTN